MSKHIFCIILALVRLSARSLFAQSPVIQTSGSGDVFVPISKYLGQGNSEALSAWFDDNLEISVIARESNASKAQAKQILKTFFDSYSPRSFSVTHTTGKANLKYALGTLDAGGENFTVTIFVSSKGDGYLIQQLKIERQ